jgi:[ribosomal protein S18]-alanine N-acetyltransferase
MGAEDSRAASRVEIRSCQQRDLPALRKILAQSPEAANWSAGSLQSVLEQDTRHFLVASKGAEILGFVAGQFVADEAEILNLAVAPAHRREGLGKALVHSLLAAFAGKGVATVFLEVRESNRAAIAFYEQMGFARAGIRPGYYSDPPEAALVLRRQLVAVRTARTHESG